MVLVADRGMVTRANIDALAATNGVGWITAQGAQVKRLAIAGHLHPSRFDQIHLAEIPAMSSPASG